MAYNCDTVIVLHLQIRPLSIMDCRFLLDDNDLLDLGSLQPALGAPGEG